MSSSLRSIAVVALATVGSRVLGLARVSLLVAVFGAGRLTDAFLYAFLLPNLFRRLFGEGALTSALVPLLGEALEREGRPSAFALFNQALSRAVLFLLALVLVLWVGLFAVYAVPAVPAHWRLWAELAIVLLPYTLLICTAALLAAALNTVGRFTVAALSQVWLNLTWIVFLGGIAVWVTDEPRARLGILCLGVLTGGLLQAGLPALALGREGWRPRFDLRAGPRLGLLQRRLLPALAGAAVFQVNLFLSNSLAFALGASAVSTLFLGNLLLQLPLGVFVIAVTTVLFPEISRLAGAGKWADFAARYARGMRLIWAVSLPAAAGLIALRGPILTVLFEWGRFGAGDVRAVEPVVLIYACGLPFYALATFATRGLHALGDTRSPLRWALVSLVLNLGLSVALMFPLGVSGLALANVMAAAVQGLGLRADLRRSRAELRGRPQDLLAFAKIVFAAVLMGLFAGSGELLLAAAELRGRVLAWATVFAVIPLSVLLYGGLLALLKVEELAALTALVRRRLGASAVPPPPGG